MSINTIKKSLLEKYDPNEEGTWQIFGEDPNCDWGGYHHKPFIGIVTGKYGDVVEYALSCENFTTWGFGGNIIKTEIMAVPQVFVQEKKSNLEKRKAELAQELSEVETELKRYNND